MSLEETKLFFSSSCAELAPAEEKNLSPPFALPTYLPTYLPIPTVGTFPVASPTPRRDRDTRRDLGPSRKSPSQRKFWHPLSKKKDAILLLPRISFPVFNCRLSFIRFLFLLPSPKMKIFFLKFPPSTFQSPFFDA